MTALDHPLTQSLLFLDTLNLFNHLNPKVFMVLLVLRMLSELVARTAGTGHDRLLLDGIERTLDGLGNGMLVSQPRCFPRGREGGSLGEGDLVEFHAVQQGMGERKARMI